MLNRSYMALRRLRTIGLLGLLALLLALGSASRIADAAPPKEQQQVQELLQQDGSQFPSIVARVNGQPISGQLLAQQVYIVQSSQVTGSSKTETVRTALDQIITKQLLLQAAPGAGIVVTEAEAQAFAQEQLRMATQAKGGSALEIADIQAKQRGLSVPDYFNDPAVVESYRQVLTIGRMRQKLFETLPVAQRGDTLAQNTVIQVFLEQHRVQVEELIAP